MSTRVQNRTDETPATWVARHLDPWTAYVPSEGTHMDSITSLDGRAATSGLQSAVAELAMIRIGEQTLSGIPQTVTRLARRSISGVDEVSITLLDGGQAFTAAATGAVANRLDQRQYDAGHGPCLTAARVGGVIAIEDTATDPTFREFSRAAHEAGVRRSLSVSLTVPTGSFGALNLYTTRNPSVRASRQIGRTSGAWLFPRSTVETAEAFARCAAVILVNAAEYASMATLAGQLRQGIESRAVIEQAKGILMRDNRCTPDEAFAMLTRASNRADRKVRDIARTIVEATQSAG